MTAKKRKKKEPTFEESLGEVEEIVHKLESGQAELEEGLALYEKGIGALRHCHELLDRAEEKIKQLSKSQKGDIELTDFARKESDG